MYCMKYMNGIPKKIILYKNKNLFEMFDLIF